MNAETADRDRPGPVPDELKEVFDRLGVQPGDWAALDPVPLLLAAWDDGRMSPDEASRVRSAVGAGGGFLADLTLEGQQRPREREQLRLAAALLCWHLAKDLGPDERARRLWEFGDLGRRTLRRREAVDAVLEDLRSTVDGFLPRRRFRREGELATIPEPEVRLPWLPEVASWQPLIVTPLAELVNAAPGRDREELRADLERAFAAAVADGKTALGSLSADRGWWRNAFQNLTTVPPETAAARTDEARRLLVAGLAGVEYRRREALLRESEAIASEATRPGLFGRSLGGENVAPTFARLRSEVERVRERFGEPAPPEGPADSPSATEPAAAPTAPAAEPPPVEATAAAPPAPAAPPPTPSRSDRFAPPEREAEPEPPPPPEVIEATSVPVIPWEECLARANEVTVAEIEAALTRPLLFETHRREGEQVVIVPDGAVPANLWFVGDLHGDLLTIAVAWEYIRQESRNAAEPPHVVFLGDFLDRGAYGVETLLYLFRLIRDHDGRVGVLLGNHDEVGWDGTAGRFVSPVRPAETVDQFNAALGSRDADARKLVAVGKLAARFFEARPRAVFLPDGLLLAHGGFPHEDLLEGLKEPGDLNDPRCLKDFVWLRYSTARRRRVSRVSSGCEFGRQNFADFCQVATKRLGIPVGRMVRGHDHVPDRYRVSEEWGHPVVTINALSRPLEGEYGVARYPRPVVAQHVPGGLPRLHLLSLPHADVDRAYRADEAAPAPDMPR